MSWVFRFYSVEPEGVFRLAGKRWPSAIVRRNAWKVGSSPIWYSTVVLDDQAAADEFQHWLDLNAQRENISRHMRRGGGDHLTAYDDVLFHRGGVSSRLRLFFNIRRRELGRLLRHARGLAQRLWRSLRS